MTAVPRAAWICVLVAVLNGIAWSLIVPLFQIPDEQSHTGYAQYIAETGKPPAGDADVPGLSDEERGLLEALGWHEVIHRPDSRPVISEAAHRRLEEAADASADRSGEGGQTTASANPPIYYAAAAAVYRLSPSTSLADRVHAMRLLSVLFAAITVLFAFLFLRELLPAQPWAWSVGGLALAFQPQFGFTSSSVTSDSLLFAAAAGAFFLLALSFRRGLTTERGIALGAVTAVGVLAKIPMLGLLPGIALGVLLLIRRAGPERRREALRGAMAAAGVFAAPVLLYMLLNVTVWDRGIFFGGEPEAAATAATGGSATGVGEVTSLRGGLSYLWQFYLPPLPSMEDTFAGYPLRDIWFEGGVGHFGWLDYRFPEWVYDLAIPLALAILALAARELYLHREALRARLDELLTYGAIAVGLLVLVGWASYIGQTSNPSGFEQARYTFPLLAIYAALIALAARGAGRRWGQAAGVLIVSLAIAHTLVAMLLTLTRYYG